MVVLLEGERQKTRSQIYSSWSQKRHHGAHFAKRRVQEGSAGLEELESTASNTEGSPALAEERVKRGLGGWKQSLHGSRPARAQAQRGLWGSSASFAALGSSFTSSFGRRGFAHPRRG